MFQQHTGRRPRMELSAALCATDISSRVGRRCAGVTLAGADVGNPWSGDTQQMKLQKFIKNRKAKGFTLVELIAVVSVILILVAIVVPRIGDLRGKAADARSQSNVKIVQSAVERAAVEGALTAANATDQAAIYSVLTTATNGMSSAPYLSEIPNPAPTISGTFPNFTVSQ